MRPLTVPHHVRPFVRAYRGQLDVQQRTAHAITHLPHRAVIGVRGAEALKFLQGLVTNDTRQLRAGHDAQFTAFLNGKGRALYEATVSLAPESTAELPFALLDVSADQAPELLAHLKRYRLRAKAEVLDLTASHGVFALLPTDPYGISGGTKGASDDTGLLQQHLQHALADTRAPHAAYVDPRAPRMGLRVIAPAAMSFDSLSLPYTDPTAYAALRMLAGLPEGKEVADVVPLEWNLPFLHGVAFDKGCYLGQELIARTHFRGLVRKRYVPVYLTGGGSPPRPASCADPIAAAMVHRPDAAYERRVQTTPGGHGQGVGHGPSEAHGWPLSAAHQGHASAHGRIHGGAHTPDTSHASLTHRVRLPFPFLDTAWRGSVEVGETVVSDASADKGGRVGKVVGFTPGLNLALVQLRLEAVAHTLPQAPGKGAAPAGEGGEGTDDESGPVLRYVDDPSDPGTVAALQALHARCAGHPVDFKVPASPAVAHTHAHGHTDSQRETAQVYRATPVLPPWWRHIAHPGASEDAAR